MSDTVLTVALLNANFNVAEQIIRETNDQSFLDEGGIDNTPLVLVLRGENADHPCHLRLAKLLAERGANVNLRGSIPGWQGASPSPLEYLVHLYMRVNYIYKTGTGYTDMGEVGADLNIIGINSEISLTFSEIKDQLLQLVDTFLECGGNPNLTTVISNSTVYHTLFTNLEIDIDIIMKFCEAGGNLNQNNVHGTTPLMDLIKNADLDDALDILRMIWEKQPYMSSLDNKNCRNETALWRAMFAGSPGVAIELLKRGADPTTRATVAFRRAIDLRRYFGHSVIYGLSAIVAPLLQNSSPYRKNASVSTTRTYHEEMVTEFNVQLFNKIMTSAIYPVMDSTYFSGSFPENILEETVNLVEGETKFHINDIVPRNGSVDDVLVRMFGKLQAGLQQLCVRAIVNAVFFEKYPRQALALIKTLEKGPGANFKVNDLEGYSQTSEYHRKKYAHKFEENVGEREVVEELSPSVIQCLVQEHLGLPRPFTRLFQIEAARLQLGSNLILFESCCCYQGCDGEIDASDNSTSEEELDDGEYNDWNSSGNESDMDVEEEINDAAGEEMEIMSSESEHIPMDNVMSTPEPEPEQEEEGNISNSERMVSGTTRTNTPSGDTAPKGIGEEEYEMSNDQRVCQDASTVTDNGFMGSEPME